MSHSRIRSVLVAAVLLGAAHGALVAAETAEAAFASDPAITIRYLPGKFYEQRAQDAVQRKDFGHALAMYEKAAYWGNKIAQYDVGMLYLHGADGVPADAVRGTAWLGIAAQTHVAYVDRALAAAYAGLDAGQRAAAGALWKQLRADYDDKVTLDRASKRFNAQLAADKGGLNGPPEYTDIVYDSFGGGGGDQSSHPIFDAATGALKGGRDQGVAHSVNAAKFFAAVKDEFSDFVHTQFGAVSVGEPESIAGHDRRLQEQREKQEGKQPR